MIIHSLDQALAACAAAEAADLPLVLWSAVGGGKTVGGGWFGAVMRIAQAEFPAVRLTAVLDCADEAGTALGALRGGLRDIRFCGDAAVAAKLTALGATVWPLPARLLDLADARDPKVACQDFLAKSGLKT